MNEKRDDIAEGYAFTPKAAEGARVETPPGYLITGCMGEEPPPALGAADGLTAFERLEAAIENLRATGVGLLALFKAFDAWKKAREAEPAASKAPLSEAEAWKWPSYLSALRGAGWTVAVHNDYRLNSEPHTFWLFTKGERAIKGEGRTDEEALAHCVVASGDLSQMTAAILSASRGDIPAEVRPAKDGGEQ